MKRYTSSNKSSNSGISPTSKTSVEIDLAKPNNGMQSEAPTERSFISRMISKASIGITAPEASASSKARKKDTRKLTEYELTNLFRRLDVNGDGSLSFSEFTRVLAKLKIKGDDDFLQEIFMAADTDNDKGGGLNMKEFMNAYAMLYYKQSATTGATDSNDTKLNENFVRASRYGYEGQDNKGEKIYIFECYTGSMFNITKKVTYHLASDEDSPVFSIPSTATALKGYTIETINQLILEDGERNVRLNTGIMWWVDISSEHGKGSEITAFSKAFGIPAALKDKISIFDPNTRVTFGTGDVVSGAQVGKCAVLSFFAQYSVIKNKPIVPRDSSWVKSIPFNFGTYWSSRLAIFYNFKNSPCQERNKMSIIAQQEVDCLFDSVDDEDFEIETPSGEAGPPFSRVPANKLKVKDENFLLSNGDMLQRRPRIENQHISLHIQDQGFGPIALFTYRQTDSDLEPPADGSAWTADQHSRAGVLGRVLAGIWVKLLEVTQNQGVSTICGELDDSSFALAVLIISLVHNTSMSNLQSLNMWGDMVEVEIGNIAVTKHAKHIENLGTLTDEIIDYVNGFNTSIRSLVDLFHVDQARGGNLAGGLEVSLETNRPAVVGKVEAKSHIPLPTFHEEGDDFDRAYVGDEEEKLFLSPIDAKGSKLSLATRRSSSRGGSNDRMPNSGMSPFLICMDSSSHRIKNAVDNDDLSGRSSGSFREQSSERMVRPTKLPPLLTTAAADGAGGNANISLEPRPSSNALVAIPKKKSFTKKGQDAGLVSVDRFSDSFSKIAFDLATPMQKYQIVKCFASNSSISMLTVLLNGMEVIEKKGSLYWAFRLRNMEEATSRLNQGYRMSLDEKRNFWAFTLGIVTIATFPFAVMTGYFGMNFENMAAEGEILTSQFWELFPGYHILWFYTFVVYSLMFFLALHYQIFYSAS